MPRRRRQAPPQASLALRCQGGACTGPRHVIRSLGLRRSSPARPWRTQAVHITTATTGTRTPASMGACMCAVCMRQCTCDCVCVRKRASVCTTVRVVLARSVPYSRTILTYPTHAPHMPTASPRGTTHTGTTTGARPQVNTRQRTRPLIMGVVPTRSPSVRGLNTHTQPASNSEKSSVWLFRIANVLGY